VERALIYARQARDDLDAVRGWLTQPSSGPKARKKLQAIWKAIERLREHPCRYPVGDHPGVRELPCAGGYRALYEVIRDTGDNNTAGNVRVLRVFGPGQNRGQL